MTLKIGRKITLEVVDLAEASRTYQKKRDELLITVGPNCGHYPDGMVSESGKTIARISYNGRVWPPAKWFSGMVPIMDAQ